MEQSSHYWNLLRRRGSPGGTTESARVESLDSDDDDGGGAVTKDDILDRVQKIMNSMPEEEIGNPEDFERALKIFLERADHTLTRAGKRQEAHASDEIVLEAVVSMDGTRPTLLIRKDTINPSNPLAGEWTDSFYSIRETIVDRARAVGRIQPKNGSPNLYVGTGWVVDSAKGLIMTNLHVLRDMLPYVPGIGPAVEGGPTLKFPKDKLFIDFAGEDGSLEQRRFRILEATPSPVAGLDVAVMQIADIPGETVAMPPAIPVVADTAGPTGSMPSFCVIGFPFKPVTTAGVNWDWVISTLFRNRFGVKRLAPGTAHKPVGSASVGSSKWIFGHDATTLRGSSGSPVLAWKDQSRGSFGIHFAGETEKSNYAHAFALCREHLEKLQVPVQDPE
jgi:Trypsin-like peptidase domain